MRTLQIGNDWPEERVGGLNRYFQDLLRHLTETGTTSTALVVGSPELQGSLGMSLRPFARRTDSLLRRLMLARRTGKQEISAGSFDLVATHFALYAAPLGDWLTRRPLVVHFHGPWAAESGVEGLASVGTRLKFQMEQSVYRRADRFIVLSKAFQRELMRRYGVPEHAIEVIPGGVDTERFHISMERRDARQHLGWPTDRPIVLAVRRLVRRMGLDRLIEAMQSIRARCPEALLLIGGSGPLSATLQAQITASGLEEHVRLLGRISEEDLPLAYRAADMTVVPSQALEGFGMITLESLASGTPVLVTPVGGLPEVVQPFSPQCVFRDTSTEEIAGVLGDFLAGVQRLPSEEECRRYAVEQFSWSEISRRVRHVYDQAVASTR